jgi:hypothetical protein
VHLPLTHVMSFFPCEDSTCKRSFAQASEGAEIAIGARIPWPESRRCETTCRPFSRSEGYQISALMKEAQPQDQIDLNLARADKAANPEPARRTLRDHISKKDQVGA